MVQERLGHSTVSMTLDLYRHAVPGMQADAASKVAALVDEAVSWAEPPDATGARRGLFRAQDVACPRGLEPPTFRSAT